MFLKKHLLVFALGLFSTMEKKEKRKKKGKEAGEKLRRGKYKKKNKLF